MIEVCVKCQESTKRRDSAWGREGRPVGKADEGEKGISKNRKG